MLRLHEHQAKINFKTIAALWFNNICKIKQLKPNNIQFKSNGKTLRDRNTTSNAIGG